MFWVCLVCFLKRERKGVELGGWGGGEDLGGVVRRETDQNILHEKM